jgi:CubicO group peptidase (beta-lactamase class C family)
MLSGLACGTHEPAATNTASERTEDDVLDELAALTDGNGDPSRALSGLAVAVLKGGAVTFEAAFGRAFIDPAGEADRPLAVDSLMRVASISKVLSAVVVMQLVEEGRLDLDHDVSDYLGWELRNPNYPDRPITLRELLAHTSSIRDAGESYIIRYPRSLREAFDPADANFPERFQTAEGGVDRGPGVFFEYCNLNYGVIGTILEKATGMRFDELMRSRFFAPLGLAGGFNVASFSEADQAHVATLYRKRDAEDIWHPEGPWVAQVDDLSEGIPTALPPDADYVPGTNGAQFSPQGGARLSLAGLEALAELLMGDGTVGGVRILRPASMDELRRQVWHYDPEAPNIEDYDGHLNAYAAGLRIITNETAGDRLFTGDDHTWVGHFGEAYGLLAGVFVDPDTGDGVVYAITGTAFDPYADADESSTLTPIEAAVLEQLGKLL